MRMLTRSQTWLVLAVAALLAVLPACSFLSSNEPTIHNVSLAPPIPLAGQPVTVNWDVSNANFVDLLPFVTGLPADQRAYTFQQGFQQATTFTFVARSAEGEARRDMIIPILATATPPATPSPTATATLPATLTPIPTATWTPLPPPTWTPVIVDPIIQVWSATPSQIIAGEPVTLRWRVTQATTVMIDPFGRQPLEGSLVDYPTSNRVYNLVASNQNRTTSQSIVVSVATPRPPLPSINSFSASPNTLIRGYTTSFKLSWNTSNADSVWIDPGIGGVNPSGSRNVNSPGVDTLYTLTARNTTGEVRSQIWVKVVDPSCTTLTPWSDLNPGPGTAYGPAFRDLPQGAVLVPQNYNDMGSGGKWVYVTYTKTGEKGWTQDKPGYLSCNVNISSLPPGPVPFDVTSVTLSASPNNYTGQCPVTVKTTARITVNGPGTVTWRWVRSDGVQEPAQSLTFSAAGYKDVSYSWSINNVIGSYWVAMNFSQPRSFTSSGANFSVTCTAPTIPPNPDG